MSVRLEFDPKAPRVNREAYASTRPKYIGWNRCSTAADASSTWTIRKYTDEDLPQEQTFELQSWTNRAAISWAI
jgi:hypothetical protein